MSTNVDEDDAVDREGASTLLAVPATGVAVGLALAHELSSCGSAGVLSVARACAPPVVSFGAMPSYGDV